MVGADKQRHDYFIVKVLCNRTMLRTIVKMGRLPFTNHLIYKYDRLLDAHKLLMNPHWHYFFVERLLRQGGRHSMHNMNRDCLEKIIETMPLAVFQRVSDTNKHMIHYWDKQMKSIAARNGRLDIYQHLQTLSKDYPCISRGHPYRFDDDLLWALIHGRLAMFEYLMPSEPSDYMAKRIQSWSDHYTYYELVVSDTSYDLEQMAKILKMLIKLCHHIETTFRPTIDGTDVLHGPDTHPTDPAQLEQSFKFLIKVLQLYGHPTPQVHKLFPWCHDILNKAGVIFLNIYVILCHYEKPQLKSHIRKGIFMNVLPAETFNQTYLRMFIRYFLSNDMKTDGLMLGLATVCTFGTLEMVKIAHYTVSRSRHRGSPNGNNIHLDCVYPRSIDVMEYIHQHNLHPMDNLETLNFIVSLAIPDMLRSYLALYPHILTLDDIVHELDINHLERYDIDRSIAIKSIIQAEYDRAQRSETIQCLNTRVGELTLENVQSFSNHALKAMSFVPSEEYDVDPGVIRYLLSQAPIAGFDKKKVMSLLESACSIDLRDCVMLLDLPNDVFEQIRSDQSTQLSLKTWDWVGYEDIATLDTLVALQAPNNIEKAEVFNRALLCLTRIDRECPIQMV
ncbi:hypothetical protein SAMD00019534_030270 [Acytostelium subglobosum LB1]|uniref:hypothetical protein n=1 Tax=Acytostelium subglobosum LB1 TaxID=1410327 RepID=UPI0006450250|nr:hypothetical protein SAMD00019534_030270 [Acytostelium subglobosum LB1]GAM19852.1 hypothetical protein SAMD00019534_030270 [Acytostelium subglobosum LB1]|eukprot:XP_012756614.1 hypothetical protein SAMD00019534_030270 [Acytostelium subglobosum LB1]